MSKINNEEAEFIGQLFWKFVYILAKFKDTQPGLQGMDQVYQRFKYDIVDITE